MKVLSLFDGMSCGMLAMQKAGISVDIPIGLFCKNCLRKEHDSKQRMFCTLYNRFLYIRKGDYLKCRECVNMLYDEIEKGE